MLKRGVILSVFFGLMVLIWFRTRELPLLFYVLVPALMFPFLYLMDSPYRKLWGLSFFSMVLFATGCAFYFGLADFWILAASLTALGTGFWVYRKLWSRLLRTAENTCKKAERELRTLQEKHQSRLQSLHHLENQVTSLLDLFEVARDFNEGMSFKSMADIIHRKVAPILPFENFEVVVSRHSGEENAQFEKYSITRQKVQKIEEENFSDLQEFEEAKSSQSTVKKGDRWLFLLLEEGHDRAHAKVVKAAEHDLAKFEVLMAYMALHVKKVNLYETVKELSISDSLTGVYVRRHFLERFEEEIKRCVKFQHSLAVLMLDIDHFKRYNDEYGHLAGDATLKKVAAILRENVRKVDLVARYGGEEFLVALPESEREGALEVAERIRSSIARNHFKIFNEEARVTISIGGAIFPQDLALPLPPTDQPELTYELIRYADKALYRAKEEGRNRVVFYDELKEP